MSTAPGLLIAVVLLSGCAQVGSTHVKPGAPEPRAAFAEVLVSQLSGEDGEDGSDGLPMESFDERARRVLGDASSNAALPHRTLDQEVLYKFLLSEIAGQRGNYQLAAQGYYDLAKATRDPRLAKRATEAAQHARMNPLALDASRLWFELDKDNKQARQALTNALISTNKLQEAKPHLQQLIAGEANPAMALLQMNNTLARHQDKAAVLALVQDVAKGYARAPEAHFAVAQAAVGAGKLDLASSEIKEALRIKPDWEAAHLFNAQLIQQMESPEKSADYLADAVQKYPKAKDLRLYYARALVNAKKLAQAREQYERLISEVPNNADLVVTAGLISLQLDDFPAAEAHLTHALDMNYRDPEAIKYYLGQSFEEQKRFDEAMNWYRDVAGGEQYIAAQSRYAGLLAKQNKLPEARAYLQKLKTFDEEQKVQLVQAEAQLLREAKAFQEAYDVLKKGLEAKPDNLELLYDLAMVAERLGKLDVLESSLMRVIQLKPDHAQAYNALGYTLADRNLRLTEAKQYVDKALKLSPDDGFILDSMGWVLFRMGKNQEALNFLERAFSRRPDPEIAAHLGEVLLKVGRRGDAEKVLKDSLRDHPDNEVLGETVRRLLPSGT